MIMHRVVHVCCFSHKESYRGKSSISLFSLVAFFSAPGPRLVHRIQESSLYLICLVCHAVGLLLCS